MLIWFLFFPISCYYLDVLNDSVRFASFEDRSSFCCREATTTAEVSVCVQVGGSKLNPSVHVTLSICALLSEPLAVQGPIPNAEILIQ